MKLLLMRHADTEKSLTKIDIDRKLTEKGISDAILSYKFLKKYKIDKIITSNARRVIETYDIIQKKTGIVRHQISEHLYGEKTDKIIELIESQTCKDILIIGHNPVLYEIALYFSKPDSNLYDFFISIGISTCNIVVIDFFDIHSWKYIRNSKGDIIEIYKNSNS